MAETLLGALEDRFEATVRPAASLPAGLYVGQAHEDAKLPLVVLKMVPPGLQREWTFEADGGLSGYTDTGSLAFLVFAETAAKAEAIALVVSAAFNRDWGQITVTNAAVVQFLQTRYFADHEEQRSASGELVFRAEVEFEAVVSGTVQTR